MTPQQTHLYDETVALLRDYLDAHHVDVESYQAKQTLRAVGRFMLDRTITEQWAGALHAAKVAALSEYGR